MRRKAAFQSKAPRWMPVLVAACFFISGAAGLVYQVIWIRLIEKVIGSAPFAVAAVLSVFMAGLALGGYMAGRRIDRVSSRSSLLAIYGGLELGIGIFALSVPFIIAGVKPCYHLVYDRLMAHFWCYEAIAVVGCTFVLIVPTALMGATLPVLCRFYVHRLEHVGARTGWLYGLNTIGAAIGVALCGFFLIGQLGVWMTLGLFSALNVSVGLTCFLVSRRLTDRGTTTGRREERKNSANVPVVDSAIRNATENRELPWTLAVFTVSGFCVMAYEVLWTRLLGLIAGPTTYCFTLVAATFIISLALGGIYFGRLADRARHVPLWLAFTQMAAAGVALMISQFLGNGQFFFAKLIYQNQESFSRLMLVQSAVLFTLLATPAFLLGGAFPLVNRIYIRNPAGVGRSLGTAYGLNTIGAVAGSFIAGFVLIPWVGKENALRLVIGLQFATACIYMGFGRSGGRVGIRLTAGCLLVAALFLTVRFPSWRTELLSRGWYRDFGPMSSDLARAGWLDAILDGTEKIAGHRRGLEVVFQGEGASGFTTVEREVTSLGTVEYAMFNSGKADASSHGDRSTQTLSAHIPMLFHPDARDVMVLGLASGMTPGEILLYPVRSLDVVEISRQVADACRKYFRPWNNACLENPRTRLILQDGRNHLGLTHSRYDVIISEPSNPWMDGLANLYTREFFQMARRRLRADGIFAQWLQSYEMDWDTFSMLGRTFASVFPEGAMIKVGPADYLLLGFTGAGLDWNTARKHAHFARASRLVDFPEVEFLSHLVVTEDIGALFGSGPIHTDNRPRLEFAAPRTLYSGALNIDALLSEKRRLTPGTRRIVEAFSDAKTFLDLVEFSASANVPMFDVLPWGKLGPEEKIRYRGIVTDYCSRVLTPAYDIFGAGELKTCCGEIQASAIQNKIAEMGGYPHDYYNLALALIAAGQRSDAVSNLRTAVDMNPGDAAATKALGLLLAENDAFGEAADVFQKAVHLSPGEADPHKYLGMVMLRQGVVEKAVSSLSAALALSPDDAVILSELGAALLRQGKRREAISYLTKAVEIDPSDKESRYYLSIAQKGGASLERTTEQVSLP